MALLKCRLVSDGVRILDVPHDLSPAPTFDQPKEPWPLLKTVLYKGYQFFFWPIMDQQKL